MPTLFDPLAIQGLTLGNRIVVPPMGTQLSTPEGAVTDRQLAHYVALAKGGPGLIIVEHAYVSLPGRYRTKQLGAWQDALLPSLRRLVEGAHAEGVAICLQINHAGSMASPEVTGQQPLGASPVPHPRSGNVPRPASKDDLAEIAQQFADAAGRAQAAGFDAVEVHGCHGYLLSQFSSPLTNRREDEYGGDLAGRFRLPLAVVGAVRAKLGPGYPLFYRLPGDDMLAGGWTLADAVAVAPWLLAAGVNVLDISGGLGGDGRGRLEDRVGWWVEAAHRIKEATGAVVVGVGRITEPGYADRVVREGLVDLVAVGREHLKNPNWAKDARRELGAN
ncbi:MAG: NADH:flavin oxidoreductase [Chloroflexi bacterium]|nr:NADH:flavin oxidoreductase [Chloroflexota bacterium]